MIPFPFQAGQFGKITQTVGFVESLPGLTRWYDASDSSTVTESSSLVSEWRDKSKFRQHATQATGANKFTYSIASVNGLNAMTASGSGFMDFADVASSNAGLYAFVVGGNADATNGTVFLSGTASTNYFMNLAAGSGGIFESYPTLAGGLGITSIGASATNGSIHLMSSIVTPSGTMIYFDANTNSNSATATNNITGICQYQTTAFYLHGTICEIIIGRAPLSSAQITSVASYLKAKWNTP